VWSIAPFFDGFQNGGIQHRGRADQADITQRSVGGDYGVENYPRLDIRAQCRVGALRQSPFVTLAQLFPRLLLLRDSAISFCKRLRRGRAGICCGDTNYYVPGVKKELG
jgi:hypothetical protein